MNKKRAISILLVIAMLAANIPAQILGVLAASETYDIEYSSLDGLTKVNGKPCDVADVFQVKKIAATTDENGTVTGTTITTDDKCIITKKDNHHLVTASSSAATAANGTVYAATSYLLHYENQTGRKLEAYEVMVPVTNQNYASPLARGNGVLLPLYRDPVSGVILTANVGNYQNRALQANYVYVGGYKQCTDNADIDRTTNKNFGIAYENGSNPASIFDEISEIKLRIAYESANDVISNVSLTISAYDLEGKQYAATYTYDLQISTLIEKLNKGISACGGTQLDKNASLSINNVLAGYISGTKEEYATISGIKVSLNKTDEEYQDEIRQEAIASLPGLYQAFEKEPGYKTADTYLEVYNQLTGELKAEELYQKQIQKINMYLQESLVTQGVLKFDKAELSSYPALLEYVWSIAGKEAADKTSVNSAIYGSTDVMKTTAVFNKAQILAAPSNTTNSSLYMFSDLAKDSETGSTVVKDFGVTFKKSQVSFYTAADETTSSAVTLPVIDASNANLSTAASNVVYKSGNPYGTDTWANELKNRTSSAPLSYDAYQKINSSEYMAVELIYVATENPTEATPHSKIEFTARMWADDGDGVYEEATEVLLIDITKRFGSEAAKNYLAISYFDGAPRVRNMALTKDGFDALLSIQMETPVYFLEKHAEVIAKAEGFVLDNYRAMSPEEQMNLKSDIASFMTDYVALTDMFQKHVGITLACTNVNAMQALIEAEDSIADNMSALYTAFADVPAYVTAGNYFEAYTALTDAKKSEFETQMQEVYDWIDEALVSGVILSVDKSAIESYPNMLEYIWPVGDTAAADNTRVNTEIYDSADVVKTTAVFDKNKITNQTKLFMFSDLAQAHEESSLTESFPDDFGVAFTKRNVKYYKGATGTETATTALPLIDANIMDVKTFDSGGNNIIYKSANSYGWDRWGQDMATNTTLSLEAKEKIDTLGYMAVELSYVATEYPDAVKPYTKIVYTARLWVDNGDGIYNEADDYLLIDGGNRTKTASLCIAYTTNAERGYSEDSKPRLRKAALTADAFHAMHRIRMESPANFLSKYAALIDGSDSSQESMEGFLDDYNTLSEEVKKVDGVASAYVNVLSAYAAMIRENVGVDVITFADDYADALALKACRLAPYDIPMVDAMLSVYAKLGDEIGARVLKAETMTTIMELRSKRAMWDTTSDETIASSYQRIYGGALDSNPEDAWSVYHRLTAAQKQKLASEYAALKLILKGRSQQTAGQINVYCVGDSLTNGVTSSVTPEQAYPARLQALLGTDYTVTKHAEGGTCVYTWNEEEKAFTSSERWNSSIDGNADIIILQLGTNDLQYITDEEKAKTYSAALEDMVQAYLRLENSPYLIISNTPVNYRNVDSTVAKLNTQLADKYGIPCVDLYAYTSAYTSEEQARYYAGDKLHFSAEGYEVIAQIFGDAIRSFTTEFATADVMGFSFDESRLNSFLTPELYSATIKNETDPAKQGLGFETFISKYHRTGSRIAEYGTIFSRYNSSGDYSNMTLENVGNGNYFKAAIRVSDDSGLLGTSYIAGINCRSNEDFKKVYIARSYIVYEDEEGNQTVYYSINTRKDKLQTEEAIRNAYKNREGVVDGYATRSLISVAKSMMKKLAIQGITDGNVATYDEAADRLTILPAATENDAKAIFELICRNKNCFNQ